LVYWDLSGQDRNQDQDPFSDLGQWVDTKVERSESVALLRRTLEIGQDARIQDEFAFALVDS